MLGLPLQFYMVTEILRSSSSQPTVNLPQRSIRTYLVALVLACLLPGVLGASALFLYQLKEGRAQLERNTLHTARALVQAVDNHLLKVQAVAEALATSESLRSGHFEAFHRKAQDVVAIGGIAPNIVLQDRAGRQLINADVDYGQAFPALSPHSEFERVFQTGEPHISNVFMSPVLKRPVMTITVPVTVGDRVRYALSLGVSPRDLSNILQAQGLPPGWIAAALDPEGIIYGRNTDLDRFLGNRATPELHQSLTANGEAVLEGHTQEGTPVLTFHSRSPRTGWGVAIGIPRDELESGLINRLSLLAGAMLVLFGIGFLLSRYMGQKIAAAMGALAAAATALGRGESVPKVQSGIREAAEVGGAIHAASELLAERAAALKARESELKEAHRLGKFGTWRWDPRSDAVQVSESVEWIYGRDVPPFPQQRGTLLTEESWEKVNTALQEAQRTGKGYDLELQVNHGDGYPIWVSAKGEAVRDEHGEVIALLGTIQDITERKRYEDALRDSEGAARSAAYRAEAERRRLAAVLEATPVGVIVGDALGRIIESNAASKQLWGEDHPAPENVGDYREWRGWWADGSERHGQPLAPHDWPMARALQGEDATRDIIEIAPFDSPEERRIVLMSGAVIRAGDGSIIGCVIAQMDITDRIRTEEALREAGRRKDEFLAMLAHELRNPLAPIAAAADLLQMNPSDPAHVTQVSAIIARQVRHMASLVNDLLDVSRVTRGLITLDRQPVDVNRVVSDAVEQVRPMMAARRHELSLNMLSEPAMILGDYNRLVQIVANLLNNAAKFTPSGGSIAVDVRIEGEQIRIDVTDNGMGMPPEFIRRAFEMFAQGERTPDRSQGGLGIGLALVKSLVELHAGQVTAYSEGPGKGSRFTVVLPRLAGDVVSAASATPKEGRAAAPGGSLKVMVVDDNADAAHTLSRLVEALGHRVLVEHDARTALARARSEAPDVCLLDIGLPGMDGRELARCLRAQPETAHALLVAVTGYGQDRQGIMDAGFDHHFVKPLDTAQLVGVLDGAGREA